MGMDRNTVTGFVLLAILLFLYLFISTKNSQDLMQQKKLTEDSIARVTAAKNAAANAAARVSDSTSVKSPLDSVAGINKALTGKPQLITLETDLLKIVFNSKGGQPESVELKKYNSYDSTPVKLTSGADQINYPVMVGGKAVNVTNLNFTPGAPVKNADGSQSISFVVAAENGSQLTHFFTLNNGDYRLGWDIKASGAASLFTNGNLNIKWLSQPQKQQKDAKYERQLSNICFFEDNEFDFISSKTEKTFEGKVQWVSVVQQFFNTTLIARNGFESGNVKWARQTEDTSLIIANVETNLQAKFPGGASGVIGMEMFYGPNDYTILKNHAAPEMDRIVNLGRDMYAFVRPINIYIIMPVFNFFKSFIASYGVVILLLTLFIRLLTSPLVYTSYLSGAKMKVLRPEIDALKKKHGDDQQTFGMEQMKLFREVGVNPLGGCIPALLQIPIFFALYSFFNSNIALRGENFLWADDLSAYDSILNLGFSIPFYGSHVSLFTLLAVITSLLISLYGMANAPDQSNPALKYMPYIFPVLLLGFFNELPSALTWYYTVSNIITLVLQFVIQNYIINHDKILAKMEAVRKKPKTKSKWQERMEQMQKTQQTIKQPKK
ncbi:MAG: membrane protein insertase YidC [Chitinophagaceae bacterium]|nr:membrane protein insertase YidC [Chitinophagaceae bacterium]